MSTSVTVLNLREGPFSHPELFSVDSLATTTKVLKQVNADDYAVNYDDLAGFGIAVSEDGTFRPGVVEITAVATVGDTEQTVLVDTDGPGFIVTLPEVGNVSVGHRIWIYMRVDGGGDLTVDGDGAELVLGSANQVLTDAGDMLRIQSDGVGWVAQT